jgi:predicted ABC-type ATPase
VANRGRIVVAAGTNGAGKSSIVGEFLKRTGGAYYNPDERTRELIAAGLGSADANSRAWADGYDALRRAIDRGDSFMFETTLGGRSIARELHRAATAGPQVRVYYIGLASPELHVARVRARVARGGHDIPEAKIRKRYARSLSNLVDLVGVIDELQLYDNSEDTADGRPLARRIMKMKGSRIVAPSVQLLIQSTPNWAKPVVLAAIRVHRARRPKKRGGRSAPV